MIDGTSKMLLGLIAAGLWAQFAVSFLQPASAERDYSVYLERIFEYVGATNDGSCRNDKIC